MHAECMSAIVSAELEVSCRSMQERPCSADSAQRAGLERGSSGGYKNVEDWVQSTSLGGPKMPEYLPHASETLPRQPAQNSLPASQSLSSRQHWLLRHGGLLKGRRSFTGEAEAQQQNSFSPLSDSMTGLGHSDHLGPPKSSHIAGQEHSGSHTPAAQYVQMRQPDLQMHSELSQQTALLDSRGQDQRHKNQDRDLRSVERAHPIAADPWQPINPEDGVRHFAYVLISESTMS